MKHLILILSLSPLFILAQDLTGTWVGYSRMEYVRLVVVHKEDSILGYTYDEGPGWCRATFSGLYNSKTKHLKGKGMEMLNQSGDHGLAVYLLDYFKREGREMLKGAVEPKRTLLQLFSLSESSQIFLHKENSEIDTLDFMRPFIARKNKPSPVIENEPSPPRKQIDTSQRPGPVLPPPSVETLKKTRFSKLIQRIYTVEDSIKISLYDNAEVDQDSVTLFFDDAVILDRYMISDKPKELTIAIPKDGKEHSLEIFAHNLGTIPPNTALIIITMGKKRFELRASYDLSTNAQILISRE